MNPLSALRSQIESILLVSDSPITAGALAAALAQPESHVSATLKEISAEFHQRGSGFDLRESSEGWRLYTRRENAEWVEKFLLYGSQSKLSRAAMETLAIIAYRQPVARAQIAAIRGVNVDGVVRTLTLRGLIREAETKAITGAQQYETTALFLELLGIESLEELPALAPLLPDIDSIDEFDQP
ncbi:SMC-Scp complex subunit ScpB [Corynebacterium sp. ES2794-CONJ1]|uniref:SMC-Scp complex subunit ScpB n=1 Tax=unclassified Corynebacterium TaxID=2624378 RepID=UPI00216ABC70|nr:MULTISPECIES: SMC-Scp complex subunit ScpB [unclassified Corynebacterium]MCS4530908.1 SMC-Scp complex subunit ScpB [Corynebacterium sp. ES2730-CONJ]MCU9518273.1 SMC-Scp complex subunit ScpB [Corynebacterium sp. ES2794-CONJ1]